MPEPTDMIIPMLQELRSKMTTIETKIDRHQDETRAPFASLDAGHKPIRQAMGADTLMAKFLLGDFEERLALIERRLETLAAKPG